MEAQPAASTLRQTARARDGQAIVEYALILAIVAAIVIGALVIAGNQTSSVLSDVGSQIETVAGSDQPDGSPQAESTTPPSAYSKRKTCQAAGYTWIKKNKRLGVVAHCE